MKLKIMDGEKLNSRSWRFHLCERHALLEGRRATDPGEFVGDSTPLASTTFSNASRNRS